MTTKTSKTGSGKVKTRKASKTGSGKAKVRKPAKKKARKAKARKPAKKKARKAKARKSASGGDGRPSSVLRAKRLVQLAKYLSKGKPKTMDQVCAKLDIHRKTAWAYMRELGASRANLGTPALYKI